jgi:hypothetical protein
MGMAAELLSMVRWVALDSDLTVGVLPPRPYASLAPDLRFGKAAGLDRGRALRYRLACGCVTKKELDPDKNGVLVACGLVRVIERFRGE